MLGMATSDKDNKLKVSYLKRKDINPISILNTMKIVKKKIDFSPYRSSVTDKAILSQKQSRHTGNSVMYP